MAEKPHILCIGLGYTALHLVTSLKKEGWKISGTCRTEEKQQILHAQGIKSSIFREDTPSLDLENAMKGVTHLLISAPPTEDGDPILNKCREFITKNDTLQWVGYLSTTGVYGDHQGGWADETTPTNPPNKRSRQRVEAENAWLELWKTHQIPLHIFRLSGIYGAGIGRNALEAVKAGTARRIDKNNQYFSRIHVEDIAQVLCASIAQPNPGNIYNLADDMPTSQAEVIEYASILLNTPPPPLIPFEQAGLTPMARSFYQNSRRMRNDKIKNELRIILDYPTYKEGLHQLYTDMPNK